MEKIVVSVVSGGCKGLDGDMLRRVVDSIHAGEEVMLSVNFEGITHERTLKEAERDMFTDLADELTAPVSFSIRTKAREVSDGVTAFRHEAIDWDSDTGITDHRMLVYEPDPQFGLFGGKGIGHLAEYAFTRCAQLSKPSKTPNLFRGKVKKFIPPRRIHAAGCLKRNGR